MRTRMYGGVTGKASDGLPMSIQPRVRASREPWDMIVNGVKTLKGLGGWQTLSGFNDDVCSDPRVVAAAPTLG